MHQRPVSNLDGKAPKISLEDSVPVQRLKGELKMARLLDRAIEQTVLRPSEDLVVAIGKWSGTLTREQLTEMLGKALSSHLPRNKARGQFLRVIEEVLYKQSPPAEWDLGRFRAELRREGLWGKYPDYWPILRPESFLRKLLSDLDLLARASSGILDEGECSLLLRGRKKSWSKADLPLLDEVKALLDGLDRTYSHAIVDEAQDLSPMQLRAIHRRTPSGSMTIVGDLAQCTGCWAHRSWNEFLADSDLKLSSVAELTVNYRVPQEIMHRAAPLVLQMNRGLTAPIAIRPGKEPRLLRTPPNSLAESVRKEILELVATTSGSVALIASEEILKTPEVETLSGLACGERKASFLTPDESKGLEFDSVVVAEPSTILGSGENGPAKLYVAMTRATKHLTIVYSKDSLVTAEL